jgi:hypothetical protein
MEKRELADLLFHVKRSREDQESNKVVWENKLAEAKKNQNSVQQIANIYQVNGELEAIRFGLDQRDKEYHEYGREMLEIMKSENYKPYQKMEFRIDGTDNSFFEILYDENEAVFVNGPISKL